MDEFEALITAQRADEPLPIDRLDVDSYRAIHRHLFQDVFDWAGEFGTIRIAKQASLFCRSTSIGKCSAFSALSWTKTSCGASP